MIVNPNKQTYITASISILYIQSKSLFVCLFEFSIISHENLGQFDSNFVWGARENHGKNHNC